jgi:large subunit ribosomal protein L6e
MADAEKKAKPKPPPKAKVATKAPAKAKTTTKAPAKTPAKAPAKVPKKAPEKSKVTKKAPPKGDVSKKTAPKGKGATKGKRKKSAATLKYQSLPKKPAPERTPGPRRPKIQRKIKVKQGRPRNYEITPGIMRFSKSRMYHKRARYLKINSKPKILAKKPKTKPLFRKKPIGGDKNGGFRLVRIKKLPRFYPTVDNLKKPKTRQKCFYQHKHKTRPSLRPGTILILVAGRHRGKRVVFLKQLKTGLLLVTGPLNVNGCPLRRVNKIYTIATKTRLDISKFKIPGHINDRYFKRKHPKKKKKVDGQIFSVKPQKYKVTPQRKKDQMIVDKAITEIICKHPDKEYLFGYLGHIFMLRNGMYPHRMKF